MNVLITGASAGIGRGLAHAYAKKYANTVQLALVARKQAPLQKVLAECDDLGSKKTLALEADVADAIALQNAVDRAVASFGDLDIVIANAGFGKTGLIEDLSTDDFRKQYEVNFFGVLNTVYATLPSIKKNRGRFALMGSTVSHISVPTASAYCSSKFALKALADSMDAELRAAGVSTTFLCPAFVDTGPREENIPRWLMSTPAQIAPKMIRAIDKRKSTLLMTGYGTLAIWIQRIFPFVFRWIGRRALARQ